MAQSDYFADLSVTRAVEIIRKNVAPGKYRTDTNTGCIISTSSFHNPGYSAVKRYINAQLGSACVVLISGATSTDYHSHSVEHQPADYAINCYNILIKSIVCTVRMY